MTRRMNIKPTDWFTPAVNGDRDTRSTPDKLK